MVSLCTPEVYTVGGQEVRVPEMDRFLSDHGVGFFETDTDRAGEYLAEVAGRVCYMSFAKPRPGGNSAYLGNIRGVGHGSVLEHAVWNFIFVGISRTLSHELVRHRAGWGYCLAGDAEVWSGSKLNGVFDGIKKKWTMKQLFEWSQDPIRKGRLKLITVRCFDGEEFVQARIRGVAASGIKPVFKVTLEDGKVIRASAHHRFLSSDGWKPIENLLAGNSLATNGLAAIGLAKDWLEQKYHQEKRSLGEIAAEAGCSTHTVRKYLKKFSLQKAHGQGTLGRSPPNKGTRYTTGYHHSEATKVILSEQKTGENNPGWLGDAATENAARQRAQRAFPKQPCSKCQNPEGHRHHKDRNTHNNTPENIEFLCRSCHATLHFEEDGPTNRLVAKWVKVASIVPDGEEMTYDLEVDHPSANFVANGFVTHNSQLSQRYVDASDVRFVCPDLIRNDQELYESWLSSVSMAAAAYRKLDNSLRGKLAAIHEKNTTLGIPTPSTTEIVKAARQTARSVLPNSTETKIFATANARSIRHFLEQRGNRHAETEIRALAIQILHVMQKEAPNIFGDYKIVKTPDGIDEICTEFKKV